MKIKAIVYIPNINSVMLSILTIVSIQEFTGGEHDPC